MNKLFGGHFRSLAVQLSLIFLLVISPFCSSAITPAQAADNKTDYILVINTYTESFPWSNNIILPIVNMAMQNRNLHVQVEHMNMLLVDSTTLATEYKHRLFTTDGHHPPRLVVLVGVGTLILKDELRKRWGDIPIILCADKDFMGADSLYGHKWPVPETDRIPLTHLAQPYNLTLLQSSIYPAQSVELMQRMIPGMKKLIFIADRAFINLQTDCELRELIQRDYPGISYQSLSTEQISTDQLFDSLRRIDEKTTGVLFSSWFHKKTFAGNTILMTNFHRIIATSSIPMFTLKPISGIIEEGSIVGGYIYDQEQYNARLLLTISEVLAGRQPRDISFFYPDAGPVFNYESLVQYHIDPALAPADSLFYKKPPTFLQQYKYVFIGLAVLIIIAGLILQSRRNRILQKLTHLQQRELESNANYTNLFNNMPILYMQEKVLMDEAGNPVDTLYCDVNAYFERSFYPKAEVVGKKSSELFPDSMPEFLHFMAIAIRENRAVTFPFYYKEFDRFYNIVISTTHQPNVVNVFCQDSTELHKAQQQLASINHKLSMTLDVANIVPWKWNLREKTILCDINKPIELSTALDNIDERQLSVPDEQYFSKICKEDRQRVRRAYEELIAGRTAKVKEEYRVVSLAGGKHHIDWVEAQAAVESRDENGKPLTLVGSSLVITQRKRMEEELLSAKEQAEESNRLKSAFLANMSHEIRTPLNAIVGFSGILAASEPDQEKQEYVNIIESNNALLLQLIGDILDLSKIEAGTIEFVYSDFDLNALMHEQENVIRMKLKSDRVSVRFEPGAECCYIHSEKNRVTQLLLNLLTNAAKFTSEGSIRFGYELRGDQLYFYVTDTGCGIPAEKQQSVFGRFVKLNTFEQGTGLGLSICQTIVQHMGGTIGVESQEGRGSTFWFTLPYQPGHAAAEPRESEPITVERAKLSILVAEDNASNYMLFESILKRDYHLIHAWDGQQAVELFNEHRPHIILMDINMPVMDGYQATAEIRKLSSSVPIIAVTAFAFASDEQKVMESGFDGYMPKPINPRQLRNKITEILGKRMILI